MNFSKHKQNCIEKLKDINLKKNKFVYHLEFKDCVVIATFQNMQYIFLEFSSAVFFKILVEKENLFDTIDCIAKHYDIKFEDFMDDFISWCNEMISKKIFVRYKKRKNES